MNGGREARAEHRAAVESAIRLLDAVRDRYDGNRKPLSYDKIQYGDYAAAFELSEAQRGQFYAGMLDYYFTGVEPTHFNKQQRNLFASIRPRVMSARAQAISKSGADLPKIWRGCAPELDLNSDAKPRPYLTGANGAIAGDMGTRSSDLGEYIGVSTGAGAGTNQLATATNYGLSSIAHKAIDDMPNSYEREATRAGDEVSGKLYLTGVPISLGESLAPCPICGEALPICADSGGNPFVMCDSDGRQTIRLPENIELAKTFKGAGYVLRAKDGAEKRRGVNE